MTAFLLDGINKSVSSLKFLWLTLRNFKRLTYWFSFSYHLCLYCAYGWQKCRQALLEVTLVLNSAWFEVGRKLAILWLCIRTVKILFFWFACCTEWVKFKRFWRTFGIVWTITSATDLTSWLKSSIEGLLPLRCWTGIDVLDVGKDICKACDTLPSERI